MPSIESRIASTRSGKPTIAAAITQAAVVYAMCPPVSAYQAWPRGRLRPSPKSSR